MREDSIGMLINPLIIYPLLLHLLKLNEIILLDCHMGLQHALITATMQEK